MVSTRHLRPKIGFLYRFLSQRRRKELAALKKQKDIEVVKVSFNKRGQKVVRLARKF